MASRVNIITTGIKNQEAKNDQINAGAGDQGKTLKIKAQAGSKYQLQDMQSPKLVGPQAVKLKRNGNDLEVTLENGQKPDVVIENYYTEITSPNEGLMGQNSSGVMQSYAPVEASGVSSTLKAPANQVVTATLSGPAVEASAGALLPAAAGPSMLTVVGATAGAVAVAAGGGGGDGAKTPVAPTGKDKTILGTEDTSYVLNKADFGFADADNNTFTGVKITALPANGALTLNGKAVKAGDAITVADLDLGNLVFTPAANANGSSYANIEFKVQDSGASNNEATAASKLTINLAPVNDVPTGTVTITGAATQGQMLTAVNTLADVDGMGTVSYQWLADGTAISGANAATFTLGQAQVGKVISVRASYTDGQTTAETVTSTATAAVGNVNDVPTGTVTITGAATQGQMLTAANTLADVDGMGTVSYQWLADGQAISGANAATFTLGQAQVGKVISVRASYTDGQTTAEAVTSTATAAVGNVNDVPTGTVTITGAATQGQMLTAANTLADVDGMGEVSYQWLADGQAISGATGNTFTLGQAQVGKVISVRASYTDGQTTAEAVTSAVTEAVGNVEEEANGTLTVAGADADGGKLIANLSAVSDADGTTTTAYQWQVDNNGVWANIVGANTAELSLASPTLSYVGKSVRVVATTTDVLGGTTEFTSAPQTSNKASITGTNSASLTEDAPVVQKTASFSITDADAGQALFRKPMGAQDVVDNENQYKISTDYGTFTFTYKGPNPGAWTYEINNASAKVQELAKDQTHVDRIDVVSADGTAKATVNITIFGANDAATAMTGQFSGNVTENSATNTATGVISVTDKDIGENKVKAESQTGTYGNFAITADGVWTYTLDNAKTVTQALKAGETQTETFLVRSFDETLAVEKSVTVTITGTNDAPVFSSADTATVYENYPLNTVVYEPVTTDAEGDARTYTLGGTDKELFDINVSTGVVTLKAAANYEAKRSYSIDVIASDGSLSTTKAVTVNVTNVNETPVITSGATGSVEENAATSTVVYQAVVTDVDEGSTFTYTLGGTDKELFDISSTGAVTLKQKANYEVKREYNIDVIAKDNAGVSALSATQAVKISVTNVNEAPTITSAATATVVENTAETSVVYTVAAEDVEGGNFTYSLGTTGDNLLFNINATTGAVTLKAKANYEAKPSYSIDVIANDGDATNPKTATKAVTINVTNVNEPPTFTAATATVNLAENTAISTVVYDAAATDPEGVTLTYSLGATGDNSLFKIDEETGEVTIKAPANFESDKKSYTITVNASDGTTLPVATQTVTINVTNVNEAPTFTAATATVSVAENAATGTVVYTAVASDVDANTTLVYGLEGTDKDMFTIDSVSGEVKLNTQANFEATKNSYNIIVKASDGTGTNVLSATQSVTINVTDVNEAPSITSLGTATVAENTAISTVVYTASANDPEGDTLIYSLGGSNNDKDAFVINPTTGEVKLKAIANFEIKPSYTFDVIASDSTNSSVAKTVTLTVSNVNEAPTFAAATATASKVVTVQQATVVYQANATDEEGSNLTYTLGGADAGFFVIDDSTGQVTTKVGSTYEAKDYNISVTAFDGSLSNTQTVTVNVSALNNAPSITSAATETVTENTPASTVVYQVIAADDVGTTFTYSLGTTGDNLLFDINPTSGAVTLKASANYEAKREYNINVIANDGFASVSKAVKVNVTNVDEVPVFSSGPAATVAENTPISTVVYQAVATDPEGAVLTYTLGGTDEDKFDISSTGAVTLKAFADVEAQNSYSINVIATDGTNHSKTQNVTVTVTNVNEAPTFEAPSQTVTIAESWDINTAVFTAVATDPEGLAPKYTLSGTDKEAFTIDESTGAVKLKSSANFEAKTSYSINVIASDGTGTNALSATQAVTINVTNVNEAPVFTSGDTGTVAENAANGTVVYTAVAGDVDAGTTLVYSLDGTDKDMFTIESNTGKVKLKTEGNPAVDFESAKKSYGIIVKASDANDLSAPSKTQSVTINVTNVNEAPVATFNAAQAFTEDTGVKIGQLTATDVDTAQANLRYTLNTPIAGVTLAANGAWSFDTAHPSYQSLGLSTPKAITVNYTVSDGTLSDNTGSFVINLTGANDSATITGTRTGLVKNVVSTNVATGDLNVSDVDSGEAVFNTGTGNTTAVVSNGQFSFDNASGSWAYSQTGLANAQADARIIGQKLTVSSKDVSDTEDVNVGIYVAGTNSTSTNLVLDGAASLDLSALRALDNTIKVDKVDMSIAGANSLKLDAASVLDMNTTGKLVVDGGGTSGANADTVNLVGDWTKAAAQSQIGTTNYDVWTLGTAAVWVNNATVTELI